MIYREADGADKIVAFERGMSDEDVHAAFETSGVQSFIVDEAYLVAYRIEGNDLHLVRTRCLYNGVTSAGAIRDFLDGEARALLCARVVVSGQ